MDDKRKHKCQVCGVAHKTEDGLRVHFEETSCGEVDLSRPMAFDIKITHTDEKTVAIPLVLELTIDVKGVKVMGAMSVTPLTKWAVTEKRIQSDEETKSSNDIKE